MEQVTLRAEPRQAGKGPARRARNEGYLPAVVYGRSAEARPVRLSARDVERLLGQPGGRNAVIRLEVDGDAGNPRTVMIKEVQVDPVRRRPLHLDLYQISLKEKVTARVRLHFVGEEAVTKAGGIIQHQARDVEVQCLPTEIPDAIDVDVAGLSVGEHLTMGELKVPEGVTVLNDPDEVVVAVLAPRMIEEEPAEAEAEAAEGEAAGAGEAEVDQE